MTIVTDRRAVSLGLAATGLFGIPTAARAASPSAQSVIDRIKAQCAREGVSWAPETVDTFKVGDPAMPVKGIVCTFMATLDLMKQAAAAGANLIVSHEPIFYNHFDRTDGLTADPVYRAKVRFAGDHGLVVWRFHDHWHRLKPEPMSSETIAALGWERYRDPSATGFSRRFTRPQVTLDALAQEIAVKLPSRSVRVVGDPMLGVTRIAQIGHSIGGLIDAFDTCDAVIAPEVREWDCVEYTRDAMTLGDHKGLILIAHERGEQAGMARCAHWLQPLVPEAHVQFISSGEPFRVVPVA